MTINPKKQPKLAEAYRLLAEAEREEMTREQRDERYLDWYLGRWEWPLAPNLNAVLEWAMEKHRTEPRSEDPEDQWGYAIEFAMKELSALEATAMMARKSVQLIDHHAHGMFAPQAARNGQTRD